MGLPRSIKEVQRLKAKKCTFDVTKGQFLGFQITLDQIKAKQEKIEVVAKIGLPRIIKEVQRLNKQVVTLSRLLSMSASRCCPFFQLLKTLGLKAQWTPECEATFKSLKEKPTKLPIYTMITEDRITNNTICGKL